MVEEDEFKIKGAAQRIDDLEEPAQRPRPQLDVSKNSANKETDVGSRDSPDSSEPAVDEREDVKTESRTRHEGKQTAGEKTYRWFKCELNDPAYPDKSHYYIHADTHVSAWDEPSEPYWLWNAALGGADPAAGLQYPTRATEAGKEGEKVDPAVNWGGYNPKIHGNYDPNANYAKFHEKKWNEEEKEFGAGDASSAEQPGAPPSGASPYEAIFATNRFTGGVQALDAGPERHDDASKSKRQMNAFFDVDAAANAHDGRSLKEERKAKKLTKEEVRGFNQARHEKKMKKRLAFLKS